VSLAQHRGGIVVLNFWASWCLQCRDEHQALSNAAREYPTEVCGSTESPQRPGVLRTPMDRRNGWPGVSSLLDPRTRTAIDYGLYGVPETFLVTSDGRVAYKHIGAISEHLLSQKLDSLLAAGSAAP
jgi:cytochrome c biogenesis protein CcmG/thiol:disulfide interchange protein DsbE